MRSECCRGFTRSHESGTRTSPRLLEISEQTFHRWRNQYGGMKADDAKRLKELERENTRLKKIVADQALDIDMLKEVNRGNF
jgi:putative transposase